MEIRPGAERRLGARLPIEGMWVTWNVGRRDTRPLLQRRRYPLETQYGRVEDLSVSGAAIVAPTDPALRVGSTLMIEAEGFRGMVGVTQMRDTADEGLTRYGVSFVDFPPKFTVAVYARLDALADASHREFWDHLH